MKNKEKLKKRLVREATLAIVILYAQVKIIYMILRKKLKIC